MLSSTVAVDHPFPWISQPLPEIPVGALQMREYRRSYHMFHFIDLRLQEGFQLVDIAADEGSTHILMLSVCNTDPLNSPHNN